MSENQSKYANFGEEAIIRKYLDLTGIVRGFAADIGASNGICSSNTLSLYRDNWSGLCIEYTPEKFANLSSNYQSHPLVTLCRCKVTPDNICGILRAFSPKSGIDFLNLDIDGYDYFVLHALLLEFRPKLICVEINQSIPPPVKFTVNYSPDYWWASDGFFGMSISKVDELCQIHHYRIVCVEYNNAFLVPIELCNEPRNKSVWELYSEGFLDRSDRNERLVNDGAMIQGLMALSDKDKIEFINQRFAKYAGKFTCQA